MMIFNNDKKIIVYLFNYTGIAIFLIFVTDFLPLAKIE